MGSLKLGLNDARGEQGEMTQGKKRVDGRDKVQPKKAFVNKRTKGGSETSNAIKFELKELKGVENNIYDKRRKTINERK